VSLAAWAVLVERFDAADVVEGPGPDTVEGAEGVAHFGSRLPHVVV